MQDGKHTPLYENHIKLGGKMVTYGGWDLPVQYSGIMAEHKAVREACGLFDVSHMGEIEIHGPDALNFLNRLCTNDFTSMETGSCRYSPMCYPSGGTVDDLIVYKRGDKAYLVIVNAANCEKDFSWMLQHKAGDVAVSDASDRYAQLALQGPLYREVIKKSGVEGALPEKNYTFVEGVRVAGIPCLVSKTGYTGEPGLEIYLAPESAGKLHDALIEAGAIPCGLGARDTLRFEASMPLYGHELAQDITPLECGLRMFVKLDKPDFIGKESLENNPPLRRRVGLELLDKGIAREHCPVLDEEGNVVGETTSGGPVPTVGGNRAMALVSLEAAAMDELFIEVRGRLLRARRVKLPFYRTTNL